MRKSILLVCLVGLSVVAFAQQHDFLRGKALERILVGNTIYVHHPGCNDANANFILYFAKDGKTHARERACMLAADRAETLRGHWSNEEGEFCIKEIGEVENHCLQLVQVGDNTFKRIDRTGVRTDWSLAVLKSGNPEGF